MNDSNYRTQRRVQDKKQIAAVMVTRRQLGQITGPTEEAVLTTNLTTKRLLWNEPSVTGVCAIAFIATVAIIAWQMSLRGGIFEPESLPIFYRLFLFQDYPAAFIFALVVLLALVPGLQRTAMSIAQWLGAHPVQIAVIVVAFLAAGAYWAYQAHPLAMDESAPYMQARVFSSGALVGQLPPDLIDWLVYPPFQDYFIHVSHETGQIASAYWPGFALLLTPFMALGVPWLCNPVLGGLSVWVIHRLTLDLTESAAAAGASVLITLGSAAFIVNAVSFYSMTAHLLCNGVFVLLLLRPTVVRAVGAGLIGGLALTLHNPVPHMLFAAPWLIWLGWRPDTRRIIPAVVAGYLPWIAVVGFGWHHLLQGLGDGPTAAAAAELENPLSAAISKLLGVFALPGIDQLTDRLIGLCKLWLWAAPLVILLAGIGFWRHRRTAYFKLLALSAILTLVGYLFVPLSQGHGWGFRYVHSAWFVLPILAASVVTSGVVKPPRRTQTVFSPLGQCALAGALASLVVIVPFFLWQVRTFVDQHLTQIPTTDRGSPRVVIINPLMGYYAQDLVQNDPFLKGSVVRMITHGREVDLAMITKHFPDLVLLSRDFRGSAWGYPESTRNTLLKLPSDSASSE